MRASRSGIDNECRGRRQARACAGILALAAALTGSAGASRAAQAEPFRLCADPTNLPFSSDDPSRPGLYVEIGQALALNRWAGAKYWQERADKTLTLAELLKRCEVVVVGVDGGGLDDLFGLAVLGREKTEVEVIVEIDGVPEKKRMKRWLAWCHAWCDRGVLEERKSIASTLLGFEAAGELTIVDDALADLSAIVAHIEAIKDMGLLAEVAVDPAGLGELVDALDAIGVTEENGLLVGVGQGYRLMNAIKTAERRLKNGTLLHSGSGLMAWCVGNVKIEPTATAIRATKQNAGDAKIDPWAALMDAVDRMSLNPAAAGRSFWERARAA